MFERMNTMYQRAYQEVEAVGDQVGPRSPEVVYFPFEVAVMTGVLVTGHEDQYLVMFGADNEPFLTIRQDGRVMAHIPNRTETRGENCKVDSYVNFAHPPLSTITLEVCHGQGPRGVITTHVRMDLLPGRGRSQVTCTGMGPPCVCYRDMDGNRVDPERIDRILGEIVLGDKGRGGD